MTVEAVARNTVRNPQVEAEVRRAALGQLLKGGPLAESLHVVLVLIVAALVWDSLPRALTIGWVGAVTAAAALRTWWRLGLSRRTATPEEALRGVRLTVAGVLLESSTQELARQHAYLDALIASTPVAIAVLDNQRTVRSVDPAFVTLFGYSATEVTGASIDGLIVPESLRSESGDLEARAR